MKLFGNTHGKKKPSRPLSSEAAANNRAPEEQAYAELESLLKPRSDAELRRRMPAEPPVMYPVEQPIRRPTPKQEQPLPKPEVRPEAPARRQKDLPQETRAFRPRAEEKKAPAAPQNSKAASKYADFDEYEPYRTEADKRKIEAMIAAYQKKKLIRRLIVLGVLLVLVVVGIILWKNWVKPPELTPPDKPVTSPDVSADPDDPESTVPPVSASPGDEENVSTMPAYRKEGVYTFLVVGNDDGNGNTDTMLVGAFDTVNGKLNIVSIPRDTLVNVSWEVKKANTILAFSDMDGLKSELSKIMGFQVDSYGVVDLEAFVALVDAVGGVDFDVPVDMHYDDPMQDLSIHINAGYQHLDGKQAVKVVRFRSGYASGDIGRIGTQQAFMKALASKCLSLENLVKNASTYAHIFKTYVDTDLTLGNLIWYLQQFSKLDSDDITFQTLPGNGLDSVKGLSYLSIYPDEWVSMINQYLSPLKEPVKVEDLGILTRNSSGSLYVTNGAEMYSNFYDNTGSGSSGTEDDDDAGTTDDPEPSDAPEPSDSPEPSDDPNSGDAPVVSPDPSIGTETGGGSESGSEDEAA